MNRIHIFLYALMLSFATAAAQIGYQVTVFDPATKAPKANKSVSATVTITDNAGTTICSEAVSGTTDEFGILSMTVGSASTFSNVDWSEIPLWISATVDGVTISKTQIMSVPVAEYAKKTGTLTKEILCSQKWGYNKNYTFHSDGTVNYALKTGSDKGKYYIDGNTVCGYILGYDGREYLFVGHYDPKSGKVYLVGDMY